MEEKKHLPESASADEFGKSAAQTTERLAAAAHERVDRLVDVARPTVDRVASAVHETVDKVAGVATQAAGNLATKTGHLKDVQNQLAEDCRLYVRDHPVKALGIAAVAGFVMSRLLRI